MENLKRFFPNYKEVFKEVLVDWSSRASSMRPSQAEKDIVDNTFDEEWEKLEEVKSFDVKTDYQLSEKTKSELIQYLKKESEKSETPAKLTRTSEGRITLGFNAAFKEVSYLRYNNKTMTGDDLLSEDFDVENITIKKLYRKNNQRTIKVTRFVRILNEVLEEGDSPEIKTKINKLKKKISEIYSDKEGKPSSIEFHITDVSLLKVFNTQGLKDFENREKAYNYWKKVNGDLDELVGLIEELFTELKKVDKGDADVDAFKELENLPDPESGDKEGLNINYVIDFPAARIKLSKLNERAVEFLELFLKQQGYLTNPDEYRKVTGEEFTSKDSGENIRSLDVDEGTAKDVLELQSKYANLSKDTFNMDALGVLYLKEDLDSLAVISSESVDSLVNTLENFFEDLKDDEDEELDIIVDDELEEAFKIYIEQIEALDDFEGQETYLPIFLANEPSLKREYNELDSDTIKETIDKFLLAFKNLIEGDVKSQAPTNLNTGQLVGLGTGSPELTGNYELFSYREYLEGRTSSKKEYFKEAEKINETVVELFGKISKLVTSCFAEQKFTPYLMGIDLPFKKDFSLRAIGNYKPDGKNLYQALNAEFLEHREGFLENKQINTINGFLDNLSKGNSIINYDDIEKSAVKFYNVLEDLYNNDFAANKAKTEIASILGSIWRFKSTKSRKWEGVDIKAAYNKIFTDEIEEISTLQVLADILRENKGMFEGEESEKQVVDLLNNLDRVSKSEISKRLLEAHDTLRILKSKEVIYSMKNENSFDDMSNIITKMETDYRIDMSANEIIGVIKAVDSFEGIAKEYGIDAEHVYVLKANFR